jgi:DNA topoisomerase-6 subunit B
LARIVGANESRKKKAEEGLKKLLGRDSEAAIADLEEAESKLLAQKKKERQKGIAHDDEEDVAVDVITSEDLSEEAEAEEKPQGTTKKATTKKAGTKKGGK